MLISFVTRLFAKKEYIKVVRANKGTLLPAQIAAFESSLKSTMSQQTSWLNFKAEKDEIDCELLVVYQKGSEKVILSRINKIEQLNDQTIDEAIKQVKGISHPIGCH